MSAIDYVLKTASAPEIVESIRLAYQDWSPIRSEVPSSLVEQIEKLNLNNYFKSL